MDLICYLEREIGKIVENDHILRAEMALLKMTANLLGAEAHIKGGFCRDTILDVLSRAGQSIYTEDTPYRLFDKDVKDLDIAINTDAEQFARTLFKLASTDFGIEPIDVWNNGEKTDKGRNISVWSVKLFKGIDPLEIVHFRSDAYNPQTSEVVITDVNDTFSDDFRRDIPWPSLRITDFKLIDFFGVIEMLNSGDLIITTPPIRIMDMHFHPVFNTNIHHEQVERIIRLFKFISAPYDSYFAYDFDPETQTFKSLSTSGFKLDPDIMEFYTLSDSDLNAINERKYRIRSEIYENLVRWRDNRLLSSVFGSIKKSVARNPYQFIKFLHDFNILQLLFDHNHNINVLLQKTKLLEQSLDDFDGVLSKPYMIFGFGCSDTHKLEHVLDLLSVDKTTIRLAKVLQHDTLLTDISLSESEMQTNIIQEVYIASKSSYEAELREYYDIICAVNSFDPKTIPDKAHEEYSTYVRTRQILRPILVDYLITSELETKGMLSVMQSNNIREKLSECLAKRLDGMHYKTYPNILNIVLSNSLDDEKDKAKSQKVRAMMFDIKSEIIERIDQIDDIVAYAKEEMPNLFAKLQRKSK
jgi:tRNA nucleotidyltransferase/poly(A) polymerase